MDIKSYKLKKVPGNLMPVAEKETHLKDLTKLTRLELVDLKYREEKLLADKRKLKLLPDKGKRIQDVYEKIVKELERRASIDEAAAMFSELNIAEKGIKALNNFEWKGRIDKNDYDPIEDVIDSDDEIEMDPLKVLADRRMHVKSVKLVNDEPPSLITPEDLEDIKSFHKDDTDSGISATDCNLSHGDLQEKELSNKDMPVIDTEIVAIDVSEKITKIKPKLKELIAKSPAAKSLETPSEIPLDQHVKYLVEKTENKPGPSKEKFMPFKTTKTNVHDPEKERQRKLGAHWEVTAATPPPIQHNGVKMISLLDSVQIQADYLAKMKKIQEEQAAARLALRIERLEKRKLEVPSEEILKMKSSFTTYRNNRNNIEGDLKLNESDEIHDNLDEPKIGAGIIYTVYD